MISVDEALDRILQDAIALPAERVALPDAQWRVLAEDITAAEPLPHFDNAAMDGFAVRAADTLPASPESPVSLTVAGTAPVGRPTAAALGSGQCVRVFTGGPLPTGADAVLIQELAHTKQNGTISLTRPVERGANIRRAGDDLAAGAAALSKGALLTAPRIGLLAALGRTDVAVTQRPRAALLTTGSEVIEPDQPLTPGTIRNSNRFTLTGLLQDAGADLAIVRHLPDDRAATERALREALACDVVVTTGGVSVGQADWVRPTIEALGTLEFSQVNVRPGRPVTFGRVGATRLFGLPGNPVSALVCFVVFVRPYLHALLGLPTAQQVFPATLTAAVPHTPGRREYVRGRVAPSGDGFAVTPSAKRGSHMLGAFADANSLIVIPDSAEGLAAGARVEVIALAPWWAP